MLLTEKTTVATADLPVGQFRDHLRLGTGFSDDSNQDTLLENCIRSAIGAIESKTGKSLINKVFVQSVMGWRTSLTHTFPVAPVVSLDAIRIFDRTGNVTPVDLGEYSVQVDFSEPKMVAPGSLPHIAEGGGAEIEFTAGYGPSWSALPSDLLQAVYVLGTEFYENRDGRSRFQGGLPKTVEVLIERYRPVRIFRGE